MAATLIIGLGGTGSDIVAQVADRMRGKNTEDVAFVVMDTDVNKLNEIAESNPEIRIIQTSPRGTVGNALDHNKFARDNWFPLNEGLMGKPFSEGAGQVRAISRLALDHTIRQGGMRPLEEAIEDLHGLNGDDLHQELHVIITGSLAGGTGSGILLPVAMYVRSCLQTSHSDYGSIIRGLFLEPDTFFDVIPDENERNSLRRNAYAAVRELDAFFRKAHAGNVADYKHVVFNAPQPGSGERVNYDNILPYNFVFLLDATNMRGEYLPTKKAYERHAADIIYAQTLSPMAAESNSKEDNVIQAQIQSEGRAHYCGAGTSFLEYPVDTIRRYIALKWACESIDTEWRSIDKEYLEKRDSGSPFSLSEYYAQSFRQHRNEGTSLFVVNAAKYTTKTKKEYHGKGAGRTELDVETELSTQFLTEVMSGAREWNESELLSKPEIGKTVTAGKLKSIPSESSEFIELRKAYGDDEVGFEQDLSRRFERFLGDLKQYSGAVKSATERYARLAFSQTYSVPRHDDPFKVHANVGHFEHLISDGEGGTRIHPAGMRYVLYSCMEKLKTKKKDLESRQLSIWDNEIDLILEGRYDYDPEHPGDQDISQAINNILNKDQASKSIARKFKDALKDTFNKIVSKEVLNGGDVEVLVELAQTLTSTKQKVDDWRLLTVQICALNASYAYLKRIANAYEEFFGALDSCIPAMKRDIKDIETNADFNSRRGKTHRYVCADARSLKKTYQDCKRTDVVGELPQELCTTIYKELLRMAGNESDDTKGKISQSARRKQYETLFEDTVMRHWLDCVGGARNANAALVGKTVLEALVDEANYALDGTYVSEDERNRAISLYIKRVFVSMRHLATPFIEEPSITDVRDISVCTYHPDNLTKVSAYLPTIEQMLSKAGGSPDEETPTNVIMFYRSVYGFCSDDLPKFAPEHIGHEHRAEGEYHRAYWSLVSGLSPDLSKNHSVTPHIDRNWHLIKYLPDLNAEYEQKLFTDIYHAFLYGILWKEFSNDRFTGGNRFVLSRRDAKHPKMNLLVTNNTICDRFYEVYDAIEFNPCVVTELLDRYHQAIRNETDQMSAPTLKNCVLLSEESGLGPVELDGKSHGNTLEDLTLPCIGYAKSTLMDPDFVGLSIDTIMASFVTKFTQARQVKQEKEGKTVYGDMRMSIFVIPLLYQLSMRHGIDRDQTLEGMIDATISFVRRYFAHFCDADDLNTYCSEFLMDQYLVFEANLAWLETYSRDVRFNKVATQIRSTVRGIFVNKGTTSFDYFAKAIDNAWL